MGCYWENFFRIPIPCKAAIPDRLSCIGPLDILKIIYILYGMWTIFEHRRVDKQLKSMPQEILKRYEKWKDIVMISGPQGLRLIKGFHDEALRGKWKGHRSSRLGLHYRVIYKTEASRVLVQVVSLTAHDYRRQ